MCIRYNQVLTKFTALVGILALGASPVPVFGDGATRDLPDYYEPEVTFVVSIAIDTPEGTMAVGLEDAPPTGWVVGAISDNGEWDAENEKVKWGPFFAPFPSEVTYELTAPLGTTGEHCFAGTVSFDGINQDIGGDQCIPGQPPEGGATRDLPDYYEPEVTFVVSIAIDTPEGTMAVGLEDAPPTGWVVGAISDNGEWDAENEKVKWGPFFAPFPSEVTYELTAPLGTTGEHCFAGTVSFDGINQDIVGDECISDHIPGDLDGDGDVDLADYAIFIEHFTGPGS